MHNLLQFEDGKFIKNVNKLRFSIYNKKYKLIFQKNGIFISSICIINNNNFILITKENIFFESEKDTTKDYRSEIIYDFGHKNYFDLKTIYSKELNKLFIMKPKGVCFF